MAQNLIHSATRIARVNSPCPVPLQGARPRTAAVVQAHSGDLPVNARAYLYHARHGRPLSLGCFRSGALATTRAPLRSSLRVRCEAVELDSIKKDESTEKSVHVVVDPLANVDPFVLESSVLEEALDGGDGSGNGGRGDDGKRDGDGGEQMPSLVSALSAAGKTLDSVPPLLAAALKEGRVPVSTVAIFAALEQSMLSKFFLGFSGFLERLLADQMFITKVG